MEVEPEEAPFLAPWDEDEIIGDGFQIAPRETEDDAANNRHSLNRALKRRVFLIVQDPVTLKWFFPSTEKAPEETMKDACMRELEETIGSGMEAYPMGNGPMGCYKFMFDSSTDKDVDDKKNDPMRMSHDGSTYDGTKVFFFKAQCFGNEGVVQLNTKKASDYLFVTQDELVEYLEPGLAEYVKQIVPP